jgi:hypothetical protein
MDLSKIQSIVFIEYKKNGYLDMWNSPIMENETQTQKIFDIAELSLISTEVSEAIENIRSELRPEAIIHLKNECADILIRTLNFMSRKGFNAEKIILHKNKINMNRGYLHDKIV